MLLTRRFGGDVENQIVALTHDSSHMVFSHLIDLVLGDPLKQDYADNRHKEYVYDSDLAEILTSDGFDAERIADVKKFPLVDRDVPDLCADRIDYTLREFFLWAYKDDASIVKQCLDDLKLYEERIIFASMDSAEKFARGYMKCETESWNGVKTGIRFSIFAQVMKEALGKGIVTEEDLYRDDAFVTQKLEKSRNREIKRLMKILSGEIRYEEVEKDGQYSWKRKFRYVDPEFVVDRSVFRLSEVDSSYRNLLEKQRKRLEKGFHVNILP